MKIKKDLLLIIGITLLIYITTITLFIMNFGTVKLNSQIIRLCFTILLCYFLYRESELARFIFIILFGISGVYGIVKSIQFNDVYAIIVMMLMSFFYLGSSVYLLAIKDWKE